MIKPYPQTPESKALALMTGSIVAGGLYALTMDNPYMDAPGPTIDICERVWDEVQAGIVDCEVGEETIYPHANIRSVRVQGDTYMASGAYDDRCDMVVAFDFNPRLEGGWMTCDDFIAALQSEVPFLPQ